MRTLSMAALAATALVVASPADAQQRSWSNGHWAPRTGGTVSTPVIRNVPSTTVRTGGTRWNGNGGTRWNGSTHGGTRYNGGTNHGGTRWNGGSHWGGTRWGNRIGGRWHAGVKAPGGWNAYRRPHRGWTLPSYWVAPSFFISDYWSWGLSAPPSGYHWSRYYDDAVLVDDYGRVFDSRDGVDWDRGYDDYEGGYSDDYSYGEGSYSDSYASGSGAAYGMSSGSDGYSYSSSQGAGYPPPPPPAGNCGVVYPAPPPGYGSQGCSTYSSGGAAPPVVYAPPAEQVQSYHSERSYAGGYAPGPGCGNPCVVTTGGYHGGGGYYGGGTTTTTVVINPAPVTTTTTVTEEVVEYAAPVRTVRRKPKKVWRKPKPRCSCVCTTVCR